MSASSTSGSRLPTLGTPHRFGTPPTPSGIPTPTHRRPRSSLGPAQSGPASVDTDALDHLQEALKRRPPSSMRKLLDEADAGSDPDTPTHSTFPSGGLAPPNSSMTPRTPMARSRTPNGGPPPTSMRAPITPSATSSRSSSARPSIGMGRPSIGGATSGPSSSGMSGVFTPRRTSMASSTTSTTPYARTRPESRAGDSGGGGRFAPQVGDKVRMQGMGMEGTLRFLGPTQFKEGVWAGVELEGGFKGMGKNDGSVEGVEYFTCPPKCGVFILAARLSAPTATTYPSRPASVASHISHSSVASGRMTPAHERNRPSTATPGKARTVSTTNPSTGRYTPRQSTSTHTFDPSEPLPEENLRPQRTTLGISTSTNTTPGKITAGSRASKYIGMTAKQLQSAREGTLGASVRGLGQSTSMTPKPPRISMGGGAITPGPGGRPRPSIGLGGGNMITPKPKPRGSMAQMGLGYGGENGRENMPPPPSPSKGRIGLSTAQSNINILESQIKELQARNLELEAEVQSVTAAAAEAAVVSEEPTADLEALRNEIEAATNLADELKHHLAQVQEDARQATDLAEELLEREKSVDLELEALREEMKGLRLGKEEAEAGLEAKRGEVRALEVRVGEVEGELGDAEGHVEELRAAGQATISLYEQKLSDQETRSYELEDRIRVLEDKLTKSESERIRLSLTSPTTSTEISSSLTPSTSLTAAEIDNETLATQIKHLQSKISLLEDQLEEARGQLESEAEAWKTRLEKARAGDKEKSEIIRSLRDEIGGLQGQAKGAKGRIGELEGALSEVRGALEGARGEIEGLRVEAAEATTLRTALQKASTTESDLVTAETSLNERTTEVEQLKMRMIRFEEMKKDCERFEAQVAALQAELASLERRSPNPDPNLPSPNHPRSLHPPLPLTPTNHTTTSTSADSSYRKPRLSTGSQEGDEQKMHGYHHVIKELTRDNQALVERIKSLEADLENVREEVRLLDEIKVDGEGEGGSGEWREKAENYSITIKELEREVSELESLIESKIYQQDDLETQISELQRDLRIVHQQQSSSSSLSSIKPIPRLSDITTTLNTPTGGGGGTAPLRTPTRTSSLSATTTTQQPSRMVSSPVDSKRSSTLDSMEYVSAEEGGDNGVRCELCEGPHELDACPVFAGNLDALPTSGGGGGGGGKGGIRCADCDSTEHETSECPMADDVF